MLHKKRQDYFFLILTVFSILFMISLLSANHVEAAVEIGKFSKVEGKVDVLKDGELPAIPAKAGDKVFLKNVIRTKSNSKAEILFSDGNILKIDQRSRIDISEYVSEDAKGKRIIKLPRGKVEATVMPKLAEQIQASPKAHSFEIHTPNAVAGVRGTKYRVLHIGNITWVFVFEGSVNVYNPKFPDAVQVVNAGFMIMIPANGPAEPPRLLDPALLGLDLNSLPPGTPQDDTVVVEPVCEYCLYIPPPVISSVSFTGEIGNYLNDGGGSFSYYDEPWPDWGGLWGTGEILGSFSGSTDSWSNPASFTASGTYLNTEPRATLFGVPFEGSASDNTAFIGGIGGRIPNNQIEGGLLGLYIKPDGTAGILFSNDMTGTHGSGDTGTWQTSGTMNAVDMGITAYLPSDIFWGGPAVVTQEWVPGELQNTWDDWGSGTAYLESTLISDQGWGLLWGDMGNTYSSDPPADWQANVFFYTYEGGEGPLSSITELEITGTQWSNNKLAGKFLGYGASIDSSDGQITGIMVGETLGTFDPNLSLKTWQAMNMGYIIETNTFLSMVQTAAGQAALQKLHIPSVEIGRTDLSGSWSDVAFPYRTIDINMNNVIFFASSTGGAPAIWATNSIDGSYSNPNISSFGGRHVPLTSETGLSADFYVANWDIPTNRWLATINGNGNYTGTGSMNGTGVNFKGAGAGTFTGTLSGTLSGTAAGLAKPYAP